MDLNDVSNIDVQIAIEEEAVCMAQEKLHENDERYHRAIIKSLNDLKVYRKALELVCDDIYRFVGNEFGENYKNSCDYADGYLQKAREQT